MWKNVHWCCTLWFNMWCNTQSSCLHLKQWEHKITYCLWSQRCTCSKLLAALLGACHVQYWFFFSRWLASAAAAGTQLSVLSHVFSMATALSLPVCLCISFAQNVGHRLECYICWTVLCKKRWRELMCSCISNESCRALHCVLVTGYFQHPHTKEKLILDVARVLTYWRCLLLNGLQALQQCSTVLFNMLMWDA